MNHCNPSPGNSPIFLEGENNHFKQNLNWQKSKEVVGSAEIGESEWSESEFEELRDKLNQWVNSDFEGIALSKKVNILAANQALAAMFGYTCVEIRDKTLLDLVAPESRGLVLRNTLVDYAKPYQVIGLKQVGVTFAVEFLNRTILYHGQMVTVLGVRELQKQQRAQIEGMPQKTKSELEVNVTAESKELRYAYERLQIELNERKQAEAELIQRNRELTILQSTALAITSSLDLRYILSTVTEEMTRLLEIERCTISEWNQAENTLITLARYSSTRWWDPGSVDKVRQLANYPLTKMILEEPVPEQMTISQPYADPAEVAYMKKTNIRTRLLLPMAFKGQVIGLVELEDSRVERIFTPQEISLAQLLANQAASAIDNARLYTKLEDERALLVQRVTERTEELSRANAELARSARLKDEFLAGMSHELRTPLNAILGSAEILQNEVFGPLTERQRRYAKNVEESGHHLLSLINDILDLSKIEAGKMVIELRSVSVEAVCEASLRMIKEMALKKQLKVTQKIDQDVTVLQADERRLKQILVNLLSNAVKFTSENGQLGLEVVGNLAQQVVHFTVWDTGIGIAPEDMRRLFRPFVQLDSSLSRQYAGTGLGLSLVSRMTELHGGGISVESQPGQGSRFTVSLPWPQSAHTRGGAEAARVKTGPLLKTFNQKQKMKPPCLLLADDNEANINLFQDFLQTQGFFVIVARNGVEAIERAQEEKPDLILMDIQMPGMDGLEAIRRLRVNTSPAQLPIIALTALAMPGDKESCLAAGANEYLSKPVNLEKLVQTIKTYL